MSIHVRACTVDPHLRSAHRHGGVDTAYYIQADDLTSAMTASHHSTSSSNRRLCPLLLLYPVLVVVLSLLLPSAFAALTCLNPSPPTTLLSNGPAPGPSATISVWQDVYYQLPFRLESVVQISYVLLVAAHPVQRVIGRAAVYDSASSLLAQSELLNVAPGAGQRALPFRLPEAFTAAAGDYKVAFWFSPPSGGLASQLQLAMTASYARSVQPQPGRGFEAVKGSFPPVLAAAAIVNSSTASAPHVQLQGSRCSNAQPPYAIALVPGMQAVLGRLRDKYGTPAMGAAILQMPTLISYNRIPVPAKARCPFVPLAVAVSGVRRADSRQPEAVQPDDLWSQSAAAAPITALLISMAVRAGRLQLDATVQSVFRYLPWSGQPQPAECSCSSRPVPGRGFFGLSPLSCNSSIHPSWQTVTLTHLLTHSAGLAALMPAFVGNGSGGGGIVDEEWRLEATGQAENCTAYPLPSRRLHLQRLLGLPLPSPPPSISLPSRDRMPSPLEHVLLGLVLEELHARPWEAVVQSLFEDLGMASAGFGPPAAAVPLDQSAPQPFGHEYGSDGRLHSTDWHLPQAFAPSLGSLHASLMGTAPIMACELQEGRDLSYYGLPLPPSSWPTADAPPYLLTAADWLTAHAQASFPSGASVLSAQTLSSFSLLPEPGTEGQLRLLRADTDGRWTSRVQLRPQLDQPVAVIVTANAFQPGDEAAMEAVEALQTLYDAWQWQQLNRIPTAAAASSSSSGADVAAGQANSAGSSFVLMMTLAAVVTILVALCCLLLLRRYDQHSSLSGDDDPLLQPASIIPPAASRAAPLLS